MTPWQERLTARILAKATLIPIIATRFYWVRRKEADPHPSLVATVVSDPIVYNHDARDDLQVARVQFDCRALSYLAVHDLERKLSFALEQPQTVDDVRFLEAEKITGFDAPSEVAAGGTVVFRYTMEFMVFFHNAV